MPNFMSTLMSHGKDLVGGARRLWNPNAGKALFGEDVAKAVRAKGMTFVEPDFHADYGDATMVNLAKGVAEHFTPGSKGHQIGEGMLAHTTDPWNLKHFKALAGDKGTYGGVFDKIRDKGFIFNSSPNDSLAHLGPEFVAKSNPIDEVTRKKMEELSASKLLEEQVFPDIGKTTSMVDVLKRLKTSRRPAIGRELDQMHPNGWVMKMNHGENSLSADPNFPELIFSGKNREDLAQLSPDAIRKMVVQEDKHLADVNPHLKALSDRFAGGTNSWMSGQKEYRVHVANGQVVPYATFHRGDALSSYAQPFLPFRTPNIRKAEAAVQAALDKVKDPGLRKGTYGFDVGMDTKGLARIIESNPSAAEGASGTLTHPLAQQAFHGAVAGKLPLYVALRRLGYGTAGAGVLGAGYGANKLMQPAPAPATPPTFMQRLQRGTHMQPIEL